MIQEAKSQFLTDHSQIREWLAKYCVIIGDVSISSEGLVSVDGRVLFNNLLVTPCLKKIEVQFDHVSGTFDASGCSNLLSLAGSPRRVDGNFYCYNCLSLTSLIGAPDAIGGNANISQCDNLKSLEGLPLIDGSLLMGAVNKPDPAIVIKLLLHRTRLLTDLKAKWILIVNDYHKSGDLLTAIAQFEKYYNVPFAGYTSAPGMSDLRELIL